MQSRRNGIFLFLILIGYYSFAQDSIKRISLNEAINVAVAGNNLVRLSKLDEQVANENYKQTAAAFLPQATVSYSAFITNNPLTVFGFKLQQRSVAAADFNPDLLNHPSATSDFGAKIEVQQPLVNMDMVYRRRGAAKQEEVYRLTTQRTTVYVAFEVKKAYLQLQLAYEAVKTWKEALLTARAIHSSAQQHFNQGLIRQSDLLNAALRVNMAETGLSNARSAVANASAALKLLMGKREEGVYLPDSLEAISAEGRDSATVNAGRPDFMALRAAIEGTDLAIKSSKMSYLPRLNAFGSYQLNDRNMFGFASNAYMAGLQLSWNVFNGNRTKYEIGRQELQRQQLALQLEHGRLESAMQLEEAKRQLADADFAIRQQQLAIAQAKESLRVTQNRYAQGLVNTTELLLAQSQLLQQQLGHAQAVFNYNLAAGYSELVSGKTH